MLCVCVNKGSISHVRHTAPWTEATKGGGLAWMAERGWYGKYRMNPRRLSTSSNGQSEIRLDLSRYHPEEVRQHWAEITQLRNLARDDPHIPANIADFQLLQFLHSVRYNIRRAHNTMKVNYKTKQDFSNLFSDRNPFKDEIQKAWTVVNMFSLPNLTEDGLKILYCGLLDPDPDRFDMLAIMKLFTMAVEATLMTEGLYPGYVVVLDAKSMTFKHCPFSALPLIRKFILFIQEGLPVNIIHIHVINTTSTVEKIFTLVKPFLRRELLQMITFHHKGPSSLYKHVPENLLHKELGGTLQPAAYYQSIFKKRVESISEWYKMEEYQRRIQRITIGKT